MEAVNKPKVPTDGDGWLVEYVCLLLKTFFNGRHEYVWDELPMVEGWVYFRWAMNNDPLTRMFGGERNKRGFVKQEYDKLMKHAIETDPRWSEQ